MPWNGRLEPVGEQQFDTPGRYSLHRYAPKTISSKRISSGHWFEFRHQMANCKLFFFIKHFIWEPPSTERLSSFKQASMALSLHCLNISLIDFIYWVYICNHDSVAIHNVWIELVSPLKWNNLKASFSHRISINNVWIHYKLPPSTL